MHFLLTSPYPVQFISALMHHPLDIKRNQPVTLRSASILLKIWGECGSWGVDGKAGGKLQQVPETTGG